MKKNVIGYVIGSIIAFSILAVAFTLAITQSVRKAEADQKESVQRIIDEIMADEPHPIGKYESVDDILSDTLKWLDRYESGVITKRELNDTLWDLMDELDFFSGDQAFNLWSAILDLSTETAIKSDREFLYEVDKFRRKWEK